MAAIAPTFFDATRQGDNSTLLVTWANVTEADTCNPIQYPQYFYKSVHVYGTFGGGSLGIQGSNNGGASYVALNDLANAAIAIAQEGIKQIQQNTQLVQPVLTGATGAALTIVMLLQMPNPFRT